MIAPSTAIDQSELTNDLLEQVAGGVTVSKVTDAASSGLLTREGDGPSPPSNQELYGQTLGLLMKAMGA